MMQQVKETITVKNIVKPKATPKNLCIQLPPPQSPVSHPILPPLVVQLSESASVDSVPSTPTNAIDKKDKTKAKSEKQSTIDSASRLQIQNYLHLVSGQFKVPSIQELEHDYAKPCHVHPDTQIRAKAAKFLFMKNFPRHLSKANYSREDEFVDIMSCEEQKKIPFLTPRPPSIAVTVEEDTPEIDSSITDSWTCDMNKLWTRANKIVHSDRISRLSFEGNVNEVLLKRNLQEQTANKFRELFASTFWDSKLINWLHNTILEHLNPNYRPVYLDSLQILKHKIPALIETFYSIKTENKTKPFLNDPLFNTLSHYKLKKLTRKPIFIIIPNGPNLSVNHSVRTKYWHSMFSAMGKIIPIPITAKGSDYIMDILSDIRCLVNEKIKNAKNVFANRPIILVGFNYGSIITAHCALQNQKSICATICLGFPLQGTNGRRGELDDPLLEITVPMQFIIGENAVMTDLDDIEDFRERMTKTETSLVVVGGADDKLVVSNLKKRLECLTQSMVDRCVADEIFDFLSDILLKYNEESNIGAEIKPIPLFTNPSDSIPTPKPKKRSPAKKRTLPPEDGTTPQGPLDPNAITVKLPPKKKRAPPKPKTPAVKPGQLTPLLIPNSALISSFPQHIFPNLTAVLNNTDKSNLESLKQYININNPIKSENSKFMITDPSIKTMAVPSPAPKKNTKKASANITLNQNLISLPSITEEATSLKSGPLVPITDSPALSALLKSPITKTNLSQVPIRSVPNYSMVSLPVQTNIKTLPLTVNTSQVSSPMLVIPSLTTAAVVTPESKTNTFVLSKDSYQVSEVPLIHQSSTRTGRQIKPPKSLDI